ncbi:MAG TPA: hypothetical protein VM890_01620 [Longimicrobium sp.]|nr:hypothetical protein [Longimicrobium sp.]
MSARTGALAALLALAAAAPAAAQEWTTIRDFSYQFDIRQPQQDSDKLGVDFQVNYAASRTKASGDPTGHRYALVLSGKGFQDFAGDVSALDNMTGQVALRGRYYRAGPAGPLPPAVQKRWLDLLAVPDTEATTAQSAELDELQRRALANRRFVSYDAHYSYETTQDLEVGQHVFGAGASGEVPGLHNLLDIVPALLSTRPAGYRVQPVRAYLGVDQVSPQDSAAGSRAYPRAKVEAAWSTLVLGALVLRTTWEGQYLIDAPAEVGGSGFHSFFQAWFNYPVAENVSLLVKFAEGSLPPKYTRSSVGKLGFSITLQ